jgi:hypothetical protein
MPAVVAAIVTATVGALSSLWFTATLLAFPAAF